MAGRRPCRDVCPRGVAGAIPSGLSASRLGVRPTVLLGLGLLVVSCVAFGFVESYWALNAARFCQGIAAALVWTGSLAWLVGAAPPERRGEYLGYATSGAIAGSLVGPLLGGAASLVGRLPRSRRSRRSALPLRSGRSGYRARSDEAQPLSFLLTTLRSRRVLAGMWLIALPSMSLGFVFVLGPLQLDAAGWGALGVTLTFLLAAAGEAGVGPGVGIWSDRRGRFAPIRFGLVAAASVLLILPWIGNRWMLSVFIALSGLAIGIFWAPAMAMLSRGVGDRRPGTRTRLRADDLRLGTR